MIYPGPIFGSPLKSKSSLLWCHPRVRRIFARFGSTGFTIQLFFLKTANSSIWHRLGVGLSSLVILGPADFPILPTPGIYQCGLSFSVLLDVSSPVFLSYPSPLSLLSPSKNQISFSPRTLGLQKTELPIQILFLFLPPKLRRKIKENIHRTVSQ